MQVSRNQNRLIRNARAKEGEIEWIFFEVEKTAEGPVVLRAANCSSHGNTCRFSHPQRLAHGSPVSVASRSTVNIPLRCHFRHRQYILSLSKKLSRGRSSRRLVGCRLLPVNAQLCVLGTESVGTPNIEIIIRCSQRRPGKQDKSQTKDEKWEAPILSEVSLDRTSVPRFPLTFPHRASGKVLYQHLSGFTVSSHQHFDRADKRQLGGAGVTSINT